MFVVTQAAIQQWLVPSLLIFLFIGGIFSLAVGGGLILFSGRMLRVFDFMNRWVSYRQNFKPLAVPRNSWPFLERHRRWLALFFVAGALYSLYNLATRIDLATVTALASLKWKVPFSFASWIVNSAWWLLLIGCALAVVIGIMLAFFPKMMAILETGSNRWYSTRNVTKGADDLRMPMEKWVAAYPRTAGGLIAIGAVVEIVAVGSLLF